MKRSSRLLLLLSTTALFNTPSLASHMADDEQALFSNKPIKSTVDHWEEINALTDKEAKTAQQGLLKFSDYIKDNEQIIHVSLAHNKISKVSSELPPNLEPFKLYLYSSEALKLEEAQAVDEDKLKTAKANQEALKLEEAQAVDEDKLKTTKMFSEESLPPNLKPFDPPSKADQEEAFKLEEAQAVDADKLKTAKDQGFLALKAPKLESLDGYGDPGLKKIFIEHLPTIKPLYVDAIINPSLKRRHLD